MALCLCLIFLLSVTQNSFLCSSLADNGDKQSQSPWPRIIWFGREIKKKACCAIHETNSPYWTITNNIGSKIGNGLWKIRRSLSVRWQSFVDLSDSSHLIVLMSTKSADSQSRQIEHHFFIISTGYMACPSLHTGDNFLK